MEAEVIAKVCTKCGEEKALSEYRQHAKQKYGKNPSCRECEKIYRQNKKEKIRIYQKSYKANNKTKINNIQKQYRLKNKDETRIARKKYRQENIDRVRSYEKLQREKHKERITRYLSEYRQINKEKLREHAIKRYHKLKIECPEKLKNYKHNNYIRSKTEISDTYIKQLICSKTKSLNARSIPQSLINLKREEIKIKRLIKELTQ